MGPKWQHMYNNFRMKLLFLALLVLCFFGAISSFYTTGAKNWFADSIMPLRHGIHRQQNIMVAMRDGTKLATDIYLPLFSGDSFPVILIRSTYGGYDFQEIKYFVKNGYAVVFQDVRGRFRSQRHYYTPHRYSRDDGYDTMEWIIKQKWSSGKIGTLGYSYLGENQIILAAAKHPSHICMIANGAGGAIGDAKESYGYFGIYENGVLNLASALGWFTSNGVVDQNVTPVPKNYREKIISNIIKLPVIELAKQIVPYQTGFEEHVAHSLTDPWWREQGYISTEDSFSTAGLHINTWYDQTTQDTFRLAALIMENKVHERAGHQYVIIDPGNHATTGRYKDGIIRIGEMEVEYKELDFLKIYLDWFDYWLKDKKSSLPPRFQYFLIHSGKWKTADTWPPPETKTIRLYLNEGGELLWEKPPTDQNKTVFDRYDYNLLFPVPTIGGSICCFNGNEESGAFDQAPIKSRSDVLIYRSDVLQNDFDFVGDAKASIYISTDSPDTDFTLKIVDEFPDGTSYNLQDGVVRLRYRNGVERPQLAIPGNIYNIKLIFRPMAYRFKSGHRISLYISSSNFPRLSRNLNTVDDSNTTKEARVAINSIYRNKNYPSYLEIPIINN